MCVFSLSDINKVMDGPFKELKKTCENWINPEPVPTPRPGQVPTCATCTTTAYMHHHNLCLSVRNDSDVPFFPLF